VEAIFACYSMLSATKLPDSFGHTRVPPNPLEVYDLLKTDPTKTLPLSPSQPERTDDLETLVWDSLYLFCGMNLVSMCGHFAQLWLTGEAEKKLSQCLISSTCNDNVQSAMGPPNDRKTSSSFHTTLETVGPQQVAPSNATAMAGLADHYEYQVADQSRQQLDLTELFVVDQNCPPVKMAYNQQQAQLLASDVSFGSDGSSVARNQLCSRHRATVALPPSVGQEIASFGEQVLYGQLDGHQQHHHHHHHQRQGQPNEHLRAQKYLYLPAVEQRQREQLVSQSEQEELEGAIELEMEMERMLKTSSNSKPALSEPENYPTIGFNYQTLSRRSASAKLGSLEANGLGQQEQDSSLNTLDTTNSNTMSSSVSSRTLKPKQHGHLNLNLNGLE